MSVWSKLRQLVPVEGVFVDRPTFVLQSDDWGLVGVRDRDGWDELRAAGIGLGSDPYDFHSLETVDDLEALYGVLRKHRDARGQHPSVGCNFIVANVDFAGARELEYGDVPLLPLAEGLPGKWKREGLRDAYQRGLDEGLIHAGLHGLTHFCLSVAQRAVRSKDARGELLRRLYRAETSVVYGHARWLSYEYKDDSEMGAGAWLGVETQRELIGRAADGFRALFGRCPVTACAPGYRANGDTRKALAGARVRMIQNGPGTDLAPFRDESGLWMVQRNVSLEPGIDAERYGVTQALAAAEKLIAAGKPVIVSTHAVNFHSTLGKMREVTCGQLDFFLGELEKRFPNLVYSHDSELLEMMDGRVGSRGAAGVTVTRRWQQKGY